MFCEFHETLRRLPVFIFIGESDIMNLVDYNETIIENAANITNLHFNLVFGGKSRIFGYRRFFRDIIGQLGIAHE